MRLPEIARRMVIGTALLVLSAAVLLFEGLTIVSAHGPDGRRRYAVAL